MAAPRLPFWRQVVAVFLRRTPAFQPASARESSKPEARRDAALSPIEMYEAGGGVLEEAPARTQELLRLAEESHRRQCDQEPGDSPRKTQS